MKFVDLSLDAQHQLLVNLTAFKIACYALSDFSTYMQIKALASGTAETDWAIALGVLAEKEIRSMSSEQKDDILSSFDDATSQASQINQSYLLVIDTE